MTGCFIATLKRGGLDSNIISKLNKGRYEITQEVTLFFIADGRQNTPPETRVFDIQGIGEITPASSQT
jgi:hypothetical protein